jgi:hypothetical protein
MASSYGSEGSGEVTKVKGFGVRVAGGVKVSLWQTKRGAVVTPRSGLGLLVAGDKDCVLAFLSYKTARRLAAWLEGATETGAMK